MRLSISLLFLSIHSSVGFVAPSLPTNRQQSSLEAATAEQAAERARAAGEGLQPLPQPKLFEDDLLTDMQQCLIKLEQRVKGGPGALSLLEVEEFTFATTRILEEMKLNEHNRPKPPQAQVEPVATAAAAPVVETEKPKVTDTSMDEGPKYDGTGGFGLAKGTANTYVIPGMDEMSPEEYRKALQESVSARQAERVKKGNYGNRNSNDYLNALGGKKGGGMLKE